MSSQTNEIGSHMKQGFRTFQKLFFKFLPLKHGNTRLIVNSNIVKSLKTNNFVHYSVVVKLRVKEIKHVHLRFLCYSYGEKKRQWSVGPGDVIILEPSCAVAA